ncbi:hypothetical protein GOBAR_DD24187 [Gossypium barbadense]|nr:hypothetical protein GOBAR_DD24187 [Gossypium barbadense]
MPLHNTIARKLNQAGLSPLLLAPQNDKTQAVLRLLKLTKAFVRVKGRTASLLCTKLFKLERLIFCSSFLRSRHGAAKCWEKELLSWPDIDDSTVLHVAVLNSPQVIKVLLEHLCRHHINAKNLDGFTALDIEPELPE